MEQSQEEQILLYLTGGSRDLEQIDLQAVEYSDDDD